MKMTKALLPLAMVATLLVVSADLLGGGCHSKTGNQEQSGQTTPQQTPSQNTPAQSTGAPAEAQAPGTVAQGAPPPNSAMSPAPPAAPSAYTIPAGTHLSVRMVQTISSKTATEGEPFSATVARPVVIDGNTVIKAGARATGTVVATKSRGRFKGEGYLELRLDSVRAEDRSYPVATSTVERIEQGKGKRTAGFIGGGGGFGAIIGGLAGGGKGALIGGLVGAGAGTAGTAFTDNKPIVIPAESVLTFRLEKAVTVQ
jgi:hypothetical protein